MTAGCEECADGFTGGDCYEDIDECAGDEQRCDEHANCTNTVGTFKCTCHAGFTQFNATVCQGTSTSYLYIIIYSDKMYSPSLNLRIF